MCLKRSNLNAERAFDDTKTFSTASFESSKTTSKHSSQLQPIESLDVTKEIVSTTLKSSDTDLKKNNVSIENDSIKHTITDNKANKASSKNNKPPYKKGLYVGALYSIESNKEKNDNHNEKGEGFGIALMLGYRLTNRISIESGFSFHNKEYYTSAKYFNKSILRASGNVDGIEAENTLIELPINLKYDFVQKAKHNLFSTFGISSYFVTNEKYEYEQESGGIYTRDNVEFSGVTSNLFASLNFSVGYQFVLGKIGSVRVQPYISIPLRGIGKGQQQLRNNGINVGWIYNFKTN